MIRILQNACQKQGALKFLAMVDYCRIHVVINSMSPREKNYLQIIKITQFRSELCNFKNKTLFRVLRFLKFLAHESDKEVS